MSYFKFLQRGAVGPLTRFQWKPGVWVEATGPLAVCRNGAHVLRPSDLAHWIHEELWRAEIDGDVIEGGDCLVARRVRLTERVDGWTAGDGERLAQACHDRLAALLAETSDPDRQKHLANYQWAVSWHIERKNVAMASYVTALGIAQLAIVGAPAECYRRERQWQSEWLVREMRLT